MSTLTSEQKWGISIIIGGFSILLFNPVTFMLVNGLSTVLGGMRVRQGDWIGVIILAVVLVVMVRYFIF